MTAPADVLERPVTQSALAHPGYRAFFFTLAGSMMADNIEHVISYWVLFEKFHSPALGGFAVISHWLPFLLFSVWTGALAERYDPRRIIQLGMLLFMGVSLAWGILFLTNTLQVWHAMVLLGIHGFAGALWNPPAQVLIHDIVATEQLQSAVRLNATARYLGVLVGPAVGGVLLLVLGPAHGILCNALFYVPTIWWLWKAPYGRQRGPSRRRTGLRNFDDIVETLRTIRRSPTLSSMILLAGGASLFIGTAYHPQMPKFAHDLGHLRVDLSYSVLLAADAAGALFAAFAIERWRFLSVTPKTAFNLAIVWCLTLCGFALTSSYPVALLCLFCAGFSELIFNSFAQALVQLDAPTSVRGHVIGLFVMVSLGMRAFSGFSIGLLASVIGIHASLAVSASALLACIVLTICAQRVGIGTPRKAR